MSSTTTHIETTTELWRIVQDDLAFEAPSLLFQAFDDTHLDLFPRVSDFTRFANRVERDSLSEYLTWISKKHNRLLADHGDYRIQRKSKLDTEASLIFQRPITVVMSYVSDQPITAQVNRIEGEFRHDWFWNPSGRQNNIANAIEIHFHCKSYFFDQHLTVLS